MRNIDTATLRAFVTVAETGGMTAAGRKLNLTQAAISQQIMRLEDLLGVNVFERRGKKLHLSADGERLLSHAQRMLALNDEMMGLATTPGFEGEVRLGVPHDIISRFMPPILKSFGRAWPLVRVTLVSSTTPDLLLSLTKREVDLTLTTELEPGGADELAQDPLVWVGVKGGVAHRRRPLPVALGSVTCAFRPVAVEALSAAGLDWRSISEVSSVGPLHALIEADLGVMPHMLSCVPDGFRVLGRQQNLPELPDFHINLRTNKIGMSEITRELSEHIRAGFSLRQSQAA